MISNLAIVTLPILEDKVLAENIISAGDSDFSEYIDDDKVHEWCNDPYITIYFTDENDKIITFNNRTFSHIYIYRPEYKLVNPNTDLFLNSEQLYSLCNNLFNPLTYCFKDNYLGMDLVLTAVDGFMNEFSGNGLVYEELNPSYYMLPTIDGNRIIYTFDSGKELKYG